MSYQRVLWHAHGTKEGKLVQLAMQAKGLTYLVNTESPQDRDGPVLSDHGTRVVGLIPILEFLNDKYPEPSLIFTDPSQKALVRMFLHRVLFGGSYEKINIAEKTLRELRPYIMARKFFLGDQPCLVDLALSPLVQHTNDPIWRSFNERVMEAISA